MATPVPANVLSKDSADRTEAAVLAYEASLGARPGLRSRRSYARRPPLRGILLAGLNDGGSADVAVTSKTKPPPDGTDPFGFKVTILGNPSFLGSDSFTLTFTAPGQGQTPKTTAAIPYNATAAQVQAALQKLEAIGTASGNVTVSLGAMAAGVSSKNAPAEFPGVWLVRFGGTFLKGKNPTAPTLTGTGSFTGLSAFSVASETWLDTGTYETVQAIVPVGTPTPHAAGSIVLCTFDPAVGYCVASGEPRFFTAPGYS